MPYAFRTDKVMMNLLESAKDPSGYFLRALELLHRDVISSGFRRCRYSSDSDGLTNVFSIKLTKEDRRKLEEIKNKLGLYTKSDVARLALVYGMLNDVPLEPQTRKAKPLKIMTMRIGQESMMGMLYLTEICPGKFPNISAVMRASINEMLDTYRQSGVFDTSNYREFSEAWQTE